MFYKRLGLFIKLGLLIFTFIGGLPCFAQDQYRYTQKDYYVSKQQMVADIDSLVTDLKLWHPNLYLYITCSAFDKRINRLKISLKDSMMVNDFCAALQYTLAPVGDGHMVLAGNDSFNDSLYPPSTYYLWPLERICYKLIDDKLYFLNKEKDTCRFAFEKGAEIIAIQNKPVKSILDSLRKFVFADGSNRNFKSFVLDKDVFPRLYHQVFKNKNSVMLTVKGRSGITRVKVFSETMKDYQETNRSHSELNYDREDYALMKLSDFNNVFNTDYESFFREIKTRGTKNLVIDLRGNAGGADSIASYMLSFFIREPVRFSKYRFTPYSYQRLLSEDSSGGFKWVVKAKEAPVQPGKEYFDGNVYCVTDGGTFSAAALFVQYLKNSRKIIVVGSESGGSKTIITAGSYTWRNLPHSKLLFGYGFFSIEPLNPVIGSPKTIGVVPDKKITYTIEDIIQRRDKEMEWIKQQIGERC